MRTLLVIALLTLSIPAFAANTETVPATKEAAVQQKFDQAKSHRLQKITDRIAELQKAQTCVQAATDFNSLAGCDSSRYKARMAKKAATTGK
jgi:hypothetical protein